MILRNSQSQKPATSDYAKYMLTCDQHEIGVGQ